MTDIDAEFLSHLPPGEIERVVFFKRDEVTADLICCDVKVAGKTWMFHEALSGWDLLLGHLSNLPGFRFYAVAAIADPPFERSEVVAYQR